MQWDREHPKITALLSFRHFNMMPKCLIRSMTAMVTVAAVLVTLSISIGSLSHTSRLALSPSNPVDCVLPCFMGLVPGETDLIQAVDQLHSSLPQEIWGGEARYRIKSVESNALWIGLMNFATRSDVLSWIALDAEGTGRITTLGSMFASGYRPQRVFRIGATGPNVVELLIVWGPDQSIFTEVNAFRRVDMESSIERLWIVDPNSPFDLLGEIRARRHYDDEVGWHGFTSIDTYWRLPPINDS